VEWSVNGVLTASDCSILNWSAVSKLIAASLLDYMLSSVLLLFFFLFLLIMIKKISTRLIKLRESGLEICGYVEICSLCLNNRAGLLDG